MMKVFTMLLVAIVLNIAFVASLRIMPSSKRLHGCSLKKTTTELRGLPPIIETIESIISKIQLPIIIFGTGYVTALVSQDVAITDQLQPILGGIKKLLPKEFIRDETIFPGVKLPKEQFVNQYEDEILYITGSSSIKIAKFAVQINKELNNIKGENKYLSDGSSNFQAFDKVHAKYAENIIEKGRNSYLPADYKYFGTYDGVGNVEAMVKYNPFFASALTATETGFEINPYGKETQFTIYTQTLDSDVPRVVAEFDKKLKVKSLKVYQGKTLTDRVEIIVNNDRDKAYKLLYTLLHHGQNIHATTHVSSIHSFYYFPDHHTSLHQYPYNCSCSINC